MGTGLRQALLAAALSLTTVHAAQAQVVVGPGTQVRPPRAPSPPSKPTEAALRGLGRIQAGCAGHIGAIQTLAVQRAEVGDRLRPAMELVAQLAASAPPAPDDDASPARQAAAATAQANHERALEAARAQVESMEEEIHRLQAELEAAEARLDVCTGATRRR